MKKDAGFTVSTVSRDEAARWYVLFQERELTERDLRAWGRWEANPENRQAFDEMEQLWGALEHIDAPPLPPEYRRGFGSPSIAGRNRALTKAARSVGQRAWRIGWIATSLAAAITVVVIGLRWGASSHWPFSAASERTSVVETGLAEHKDVVLSDGSKIELGAHTAITANFSDAARNIVLKRGEALFQVRRDPLRPFRVVAGRGTITAIGTAFNVRKRDDDTVVVMVTEGAVEVAPLDSRQDAAGMPASATARRLTGGSEISYDAEGRLSAPQPIGERYAASWRSGQLSYRNEPLRNVLPDVNRYSRRPLILADEAAGELLYSGTVFESDIGEWIGGLERLYPQLEVTASDTDAVIVRSRTESR